MVVFPFVTKPANCACSNATLYTHQALVSPKLGSPPPLGAAIHSRLIRRAWHTRACQSFSLVYRVETWRTRCYKYKDGKGKHVPARISQYIHIPLLFLMPLLPSCLGSPLSTSKTSCHQQNWTYIHTVCPPVSWPCFIDFFFLSLYFKGRPITFTIVIMQLPQELMDHSIAAWLHPCFLEHITLRSSLWATVFWMRFQRNNIWQLFKT